MSEQQADPAATTRRCRNALETLHVVGYFAPEPRQAYKELGLKGRHAYFAARSAPMGPVPAEVVQATFYVFAPDLVSAAIPGSWEVAPPEKVLEARHAGVVASLRRLLGDADVAEAAGLAREATTALTPPGRALYAGHASLPWPQDPLLALWHASALLREHRGDGHVAALLLHGLDPLESIITGGLVLGTTEFMRTTRGWTDEEWAAGEERLRTRGLLDADGALTEDGVALRRAVESTTDAAASAAWDHLGHERTARLLELVRPLQKTVLASDTFPPGVLPRR